LSSLSEELQSYFNSVKIIETN